MSVSLLIDVYSRKKSPDYVHVDDSASYLDACRAIDKALNQGLSLNIVLHNPAQRDWFAQYRDRISISTYDPCREFADTLGIKEALLPVEILQDPKFIISAGLNEKAKLTPPGSPEKVCSWILEHVLDPVWANEKIDGIEQLSALLSNLVKRYNLKIHPTLQALRNIRIAEWKEASAFKKVIKWLFADEPQRRAESLFFARLIWNYPHEIKLKALKFGSRWQDISLLEDAQSVITQIPIQECREFTLPPEIRGVIDDYLTENLASNKLDGVIGMLSGIPEEELPIKKYLETYFDTIDETWSDTLVELNRIFANNQQTQSFINYLQVLVPIRKPAAILPTMSWEEVSSWLENDYFPYYRWCSALGKINHTETSVTEFENWLASNYYRLTKTKTFSPCAVQPLIASRISNSSVLHVIIDCLPWIYGGHIQEKLMQKGVESVDASMHVTTLPTITQVAKPCLIRGQLPAQLPANLDDSAKTYSELFAQSLRLNLAEVSYSNSNESDIESMVRIRKKAYLYLDNEIDRLTHRPINPDWRRTLIESHLNEIVDGIINARESHKRLYGTELSVVISSDHGFTEQPENSTVLTVSENDWNVNHNRLLINKNKENPSPDDYFHISTEMIGGGSDSYYVARGYKTVGSRPRGAMHGGITPQEVIVPMIFIDSSVDTTFKSLSLAITGEIRRGRSNDSISITIFNNNSSPVTIKSLALRLISVKDSSNRRIMPGETATISATIDASKIKEQTISITGGVSLSYKGRDIADNFVYQVATVGAAIADQAFEDEFDL